VTNALRTQEKSDKALYHKDLAQFVKQDLDSQKGYATVRNFDK
jgi:hypothetical protein